MTTTTRTSTAVTRSSATKVAAAAAVLFGISLFWTVASVDVPHDPSNQELLTWWQESGNRLSGTLSGMWAISTAISFAVVVNYVRTLPVAARAPQWLAFFRSMGAAVTALWLVTGAFRGTFGHLVDVMNEPLPGVDVLRFATALNYMLLGASGMAVLACSILAFAVVVFRTQAFGRWLGFVSAGCGGVMMTVVIAQYGGFRHATRNPVGAVPRRRDLAPAHVVRLKGRSVPLSRKTRSARDDELLFIAQHDGRAQ